MLFTAFWLVCLQACLVQNVFSQCIRPYSAGSSPAAVLAPSPSDIALEILSAPFVTSVTLPFSGSFLSPAAVDLYGAYGGVGLGTVTVAGDLPAGGSTLVAGQVPILGAVEFGAIVPAAGTVSISGFCACGCAGRYI